MACGRRVAGVIRSIVKARDLQLGCARVLHETLLVPVLMYSSKTMICKEEERSRIRALQMDNLIGLLGIMRMDGVLNAKIRELYGVTKGVDEKIGEGVLRCFGHEERVGNGGTAKSLCRRVCWLLFSG